MTPLTYLSLGWGVQSFTLAAMMALDELDRVDFLVHSDTTHEASGTYAFAEQWTPWLGEHGLTVVTVRPENADITRLDWGRGSVMIPAFSQDKQDASHGQVKRQCTTQWKIMPIRRFLRAELKRQGRPARPGPAP